MNGNADESAVFSDFLELWLKFVSHWDGHMTMERCFILVRWQCLSLFYLAVCDLDYENTCGLFQLTDVVCEGKVVMFA